MKTFTFKSLYGNYENCYFHVSRYLDNKNLAIDIWNAEEGPIAKVTVNIGIEFSDDVICVKNYSENEGMVDFLKELGMIDETRIIESSHSYVPFYLCRLTDKGKEMLDLRR